MKNWLVKISAPLLTAAMAWGAWVTIDMSSIIFFGEYEYPTED